MVVLASLTITVDFTEAKFSTSSDANFNVNFSLKDIVGEFNYENIFKHINIISSFGSRITGYNGSFKTAEYIANQLSSYGLEVVPHNYKVVVPVDEGSRVTILGSSEETYEAYAIWPNGIQTSPTPPEGLIGHLIYVGRGDLKDFDGKNVDGSIVLMDYESGDNWLNAAKLGAKGVIFIAPLWSSTYAEALKKFLDTPLYFPKVCVSYEVGIRLKEAADAGFSVRIDSRMRYREVTAQNIIGILPGSKNDEIIIISSHYDSWASVPALANSPMEAISSAFLLEFARVISKTTPLRTVWFVFFSGHWQALSGSRKFVEDYYFSLEVQNGTFKPLMLINMGDFDPMGYGLQILRGGAGTLYATVDIASGITLRYSWVRRQIFTKYLYDPYLVSLIMNLTGNEPSILVKEFFTHDMFWGTENYFYMLDSEPAEMTRGLSFTIQTAFASKHWMGDPFQIFDLDLLSERFSFLVPQFMIASHIALSFINEPEWGAKWSETSPSRLFLSPGGFAQYSGFITLRGQTLEYNLSKGWYSPIPRALVRVYMGIVIGNLLYSPYPYPFNKYITFSDENGTFEVHGLSPYPFVPGKYIIEAWVVDESSGKIIYAPDLGVYGAKMIRPVVSPLSHPEKCSVVLMRAETIALFDVFDPRNGITGLVPDFRSPTFAQTGGWFYDRGIVVVPQDFISKGDLLFYGVYYNEYETVALAFVLPKSKVMVMAKSGGLSKTADPRPFLILTNSSIEEPEGYGITSLGDSPYIYRGDALKYSKDIVLIARSRYYQLCSHGVRSLSVEEKLLKAEEYLKEAMRAYMDKRYSDAYVKALAAWAWGSRTYDEVMTLIDDSGRTSLFFFLIIILAAILLERLLIQSSGKRQVIIILALGSVLLLFFGIIHPALTVVTNTIMAVLGLISFILFAVSAGILGDETQKVLKELSHRILGYHVIEKGRSGLLAMALNISIENMRRRKIRTILVFSSLITVSFALTSFTSISPYIGVKYVPWGVHSPQYQGILIKSGFSVPPRDILGFYTTDVVKGVIGEKALILPRSWYYPSSIGPSIGVVTKIASEGGNLTYEINAMLGLTIEDVKSIFLNYSDTFIIYDGADKYWCLIPSSAAEKLRVGLGDNIIVQGIKLKVIGIYNTSIITTELTRDLSGLSITPTDPYYVSVLGVGVTIPLSAGQQPPQLSWSRIIIVPYKLALELGGYTAEISIKFPANTNIKTIDNLSKDIANILDLPVYIGTEEKVKVVSRISTFSAFGLEGIIILLIIGAFNIATTLIGIQQERAKDMFVYTSLGLSPSGAMTMIILESLTYSILSLLTGYFLGFIGNMFFKETGVLPPDFTFNYASLFAAISLLIILFASFVSSLYPAYLASKLITPSLERKWRPPTKPKDDLWEMPLPVRIDSLDEVKGMLTFLREYYIGMGAERAYYKILESSLHLMDTKEPRLTLKVALAPYEAGVAERVSLNAVWNEKSNNYSFTVVMERLIGKREIWVQGSTNFVDDLRKQILLWRFLPENSRRKYIEIARKAT
ncbi:MAG: FtsX-like permease family protein [Nitrososphaerota archaeon]